MTAFRALTRNVVRSSFRIRTALFFTLLLPIFLMVIFGTVLGNTDIKLTIGLVDNDRSPASGQLIEALKKVDGITIDTGDQSTEMDQLHKNKVSSVVILPPGLGAALNHQGGSAEIAFFQPSGAAQSAGVARQVVGQVVNGFVSGGAKPAVSVGQPQTASVNDIKAVDFFLPSMIAYIILQAGINLVAIGLVDLRVRKVLRRLLATPLRPVQILGAQVTGGAVTVLMQVVVLILVGTLLFKARMYGNWVVAAVPILFGIAAFVGIGFLLTSAVKTSEAARGFAAAIAFPMMFLSGVFFPIDTLPPGLQTVVHVLPLTWLTDALHQVFNDGAGLSAITLDLVVLAAWAVGTFAIATWRFRWE